MNDTWNFQSFSQGSDALHGDLLPHLFRSEFGKICAVIARQFGADHIDAAEDIASETFLAALESWPYKGLPENPTAWLYAVAKNKARNHIARRQNFSERIAPHLSDGTEQTEALHIDLSEINIKDSQLRMLFAICHPAIAEDVQIALALRILCGFGIDEIATALLATREAITKRLYRGKQTLREVGIQIEMPDIAETLQRMQPVLRTLYLLFSEGYYSESHDAVLREDLCLEAMRLTYLLHDDVQTDLPETCALMALMCFHASRFKARRSDAGELILFHAQDRSLWNRQLISRGAEFLQHASWGGYLTKYHLEAAIAYWHTVEYDTEEKWTKILDLYNHLLQLEYSPVAALNRTYALSKVHGNEIALREAEKLKLNNNQYYFALLGELYAPTNLARARECFESALKLARTEGDRTIISRRIDNL